MTVEDRPKIHVVFGMSAAGGIRQAFLRLGCRERVIGMPDNLSFGPIDCLDAEARQAEVEALLDCDWAEIPQATELFWAEAVAPGTMPVAWVCRNHPAEYAGFLEFIRRVQDAAFLVVDATLVEIPSDREGKSFVAWSLGLLSPEQIVAARLIDRQSSLSASAIDAYGRAWQRLQIENAPFRIVDGTDLVSAPLIYFDAMLLCCVTADWEPAAIVVGRTMGEFYDRPFREMPSDLVIWSRVRSLAKTGPLEISGDGMALRGSFVRKRGER